MMMVVMCWQAYYLPHLHWSLELYCFSSHVSHLKANAYLTELRIRFTDEWPKELLPHIVTVLEHNKTLQHLYLLQLDYVKVDITIEAVQTISKAISENNTLKTLRVETESLSKLSEDVRRDLQLDPRIILEQPLFCVRA